MLARIGLLVSVCLLLALPASANSYFDDPWYWFNSDQWWQMWDGGSTGGGTTGGSGGCPYYMCGNATPNVQSAYVWCENTVDPSKSKWVDCPIAYCSYQSCVGSNCTPETIDCTACTNQKGNNVHVQECPSTNP